MTIHLPNDVERDILAEVYSGHFAYIDDALSEAWRSFQQQRYQHATIHGARNDRSLTRLMPKCSTRRLNMR